MLGTKEMVHTQEKTYNLVVMMDTPSSNHGIICGAVLIEIIQYVFYKSNKYLFNATTRIKIIYIALVTYNHSATRCFKKKSKK